MNINNLYELLKENDTQKLKDFINDKTLVNEDARVISIYLIYYNNNIIEELIKKVLDINLKYPKIYVMEILINFAIDKKRYDFLIPFFKCVPNLNLLEFNIIVLIFGLNFEYNISKSISSSCLINAFSR